MLKFRIYIPFGDNIELLNKCIASIIPQIDEFSSWEGKKIVVINNSGYNIMNRLDRPDAVEVWELPFELTHAQEYNWMIKDCLATGQPFCLNTHTDTELLVGAIETAVLEYERIAGTKWYARGIGSAVYVMYNPLFFETEKVWFDSFLFPFYYMDNHMGRIAMLRGWTDCLVPRDTSIPMTGYQEEPALIKHVSSHFLKDNPIFAAKNGVAFGPHGQTYVNIWGGLPGKETVTDPYARGTLPVVPA